MDDRVTLRPVQETDLESMVRYSLEPEAVGQFEWMGFTDPKVWRRRWEDDGLLGEPLACLPSDA